ncbi:MAG: CheB methylesterase domain-containing protein [Acidimicrobiales bacterium]
MITGVRETDALIRSRLHTPVSLFVIGCSTGGPAVLHQIIPALPSGLPAPVVVVQHMPAGFVRPLARELDRVSSVTVAVAQDHTPIRPGEVWLAPADHHIAVRRHSNTVLETTLSVGQPVHGCMPAIDPLARSAADVVGSHTVLIVLTGMGRDGQAGANQIRCAGGLVVAQDAGSSQVYGMPRGVIEENLANAILPPESIAGFMSGVAERASYA